MKALLTAWRFLTLVPLPVRQKSLPSAEDLRGARQWFPAVGLVLGVAAALVDQVLLKFFPISVSSTLTILLLEYLSGGLHLDGLADTADGFMSARPCEKILEIMRDSRSGPMGVFAVIAILLMKIKGLEVLEGQNRIAHLILIPMLGRLSLLYLMGRLPYARKRDGLARPFLNEGPLLSFDFGVNLTFLCIITAGLSGRAGLSSILVAWAVSETFARICHRKIQGFTGDTLGACCEWVEAISWIFAASKVSLR